MAGFLVLFPADFTRPTREQIAALIDLLVGQQIIADQPETVTPHTSSWRNGPNFSRMGIPCRSRPMIITFSTHDTDKCNPDELDEDWAKLIARSSFSITIHDCGPSELTEQGDPIWQQMATTLGDALALTYYHI